MAEMVCPKCGHTQPKGPECVQCGVIIEKYLALEKKKAEAKPATIDPVQEHSVQEVICPDCRANYKILNERIPAAGAMATCKKCGRKIEVKREKDMAGIRQPMPFSEDIKERPKDRKTINLAMLRRAAIPATIFILLLSAAFYYFSGTPQYSLYKLGRAIEKHNSAEFYKYVDIDRIVDHLSRVVIEEAMAEMDKDKPTDEWGGFEHELGKGLQMMLMLNMVEGIKPQLKQSITDFIEDIDNENRISPLASLSVIDIKTEGSTSRVILRNSETNQELRFKMVKTDDRYWKIVELDIGLQNK